MYWYFAHGGETHADSTESAWHAITNDWYIALPLYIVLLFALGAAVYLLSKSRAATFNVLVVVLFVAGVLLYSTSPPVSIASLTAGFAMVLVLVVTSLGGPPTSKGKRRKG
jgi:lipopolysaccharide export LptBFGC system permease protein LptF